RRTLSGPYGASPPRSLAVGGLAALPGEPVVLHPASEPFQREHGAACRHRELDARHTRDGSPAGRTSLCRPPGHPLQASAIAMVQFLSLLEPSCVNAGSTASTPP